MLIGNANAQLPQIVTGEYFFDIDPGFGNGIQMIFSPDSNLNHIFNIDLNSLSEGFHMLYFRVQDENGNWSLMQSEGIYKYLNPQQTGINPYVPEITGMEYYFDSDPGIGNGISIPVTSNSAIEKSFNIDISSLSIGYHELNVRVKDEFGKWSINYSEELFKGLAPPVTTNDPTVPDIVEMEYFFDEDPGFGNGINVPIQAGKNIEAVFSPDINALDLYGYHFLCARVKDEFGKWSIIYSDTVNVFALASFEASETEIMLGDTIQFTDTSSYSNSFVSWLWDFGDGTTDTSQNPLHVYTTKGTYTVSLIVSDGNNVDTLIKTDYIFVDCIPSLTVNPDTLDFGIQQPSATLDTLPVWLSNTGNCELTIDSLFGLEEPFSVDTSNLSGLIVQAGDSVEVSIIVNQDNPEGNYVDTLKIISDAAETPNLDTSLVAWFPFNGDASDATNNGNDGTINGATLTNDRFGNPNSAYSFDGQNDNISTSLTFLDNQVTSISCWVNWDLVQSSYREIWSFNSPSVSPTAARMFLGPLGNSFRFGDSWTNVNYSLPTNQWVHLVAIADGANRYFYVNGQFHSSIDNATNPKYDVFYIGSQGAVYGEYFDGVIDDIRIYTRVLSALEIENIYTGNQSSRVIVQAGLVDSCNAILSITPDTLDFGTLQPSATLDILPVWISNTGNCELAIDSLFGLEEPFSVDTSNLTGLVVQPGDSIEVPIVVNQDTLEGQYSDILKIGSDGNGNASLENGLVAYYPFNGNANEEMGSGYDGIVNGATLTTDRFGTADAAYSFTSGHSIITADGIDTSFAGDFGFSIWLKLTQNPSYTIYKSGSTFAAHHTSLDADRFSCGAMGLPETVISYTPPPINEWFHVVFIRSNNYMKGYLNGVQMGDSVHYTHNFTSGNMVLGTSTTYTYFPFIGEMDDVRIYNRSLSEVEVLDLYNETQTFQVVVQAEIIDSCNAILSVNPDTLDFGTLQPAATQDTLPVWLSNTGNCELTIDSLFGLEEPFSVDTSNLTGLIVPPGDSVEVSVIVNQDNPEGQYTDFLRIGSDATGNSGLENGLVAYYPFNGNANEEMGSGYDGTVNGATLTTDRFGNSNSAYSFDGNDVITTADGIDTTFTGDFGFSIWLYLDQLPTYYAVKTCSTNSGFGMAVANNRINCGRTFVAEDVVFYTPPPVGQWFNIVFTRNDNYIKGYLNGVLLGDSVYYTQSFTTGNMVLGADGDLTGVPYYGLMDDIRIYNRTLSEQDIFDLYNVTPYLQVVVQVQIQLPLTPFTCENQITDYDGNTYNTVLIGSQCWMKENLKTTHDAIGNSITRYCYNNEPDSCNIYGGLYD